MKKILWFAFGALSMLACDMQREYEVTIPEEEPKLVVNCIFSPGKKWTTPVYRSQGIISIEGEPANKLLNATVNVTEGETQIPVPLKNNYGDYESSARAEAGKTYTIHVSAPGYDDVSGTVTVPYAVEILGVETSVTVDPEDPKADKRTFHIRFKDPGKELNFYSFGMTSVSHRNGGGGEGDIVIMPRYLEPLDPAFSKNFYREGFELDSLQEFNLLFDDRLFDGDEYVLSVSCFEHRPTEAFPEQEFLYAMTLKSLSQDYFKYRITYNLQQQSKGDPFAQAVQVFNNIRNGYGIFAAFNKSYREVRVR
jgi:hypothetical protein